MNWFRHTDLAEMRRELATENSLSFLAKLSDRGGNTLDAASWEDWLGMWRILPSNEKNRLLHPVFAAYRDYPGFEWWHLWMLMFEKELFGLFSYFRPRIPDQDERWSTIVWSFMETLVCLKSDLRAELSTAVIFRHTKRGVNRCIEIEKKSKRIEKSLPVMDFFPSHDETIQQETEFARLCEQTECFFNDLSAVDKTIVEEICISGKPGKTCASNLGMSVHQVNRRLSHVKCEISRVLNLPVAGRITKNLKGCHGSRVQWEGGHHAW